MTLDVCGVVFSLLQTDTASVLLEAIGYIRFLQNQIEVMFFPPFIFTNNHEPVIAHCRRFKYYAIFLPLTFVQFLKP